MINYYLIITYISAYLAYAPSLHLCNTIFNKVILYAELFESFNLNMSYLNMVSGN